MTSGQSNLTKKSHRCCTSMVQWHSLGGTSMHPILGPPESTTQTASRSVWPFLYSSQWSIVGHVLFPKNCPLAWGNLDTHLIHGFLVHASPHPKWRIWTVQSYSPASRWRQCAPHVTRFLGPTRILNPNGISIGSLFFAQSVPILYNGLYLLASQLPLPTGGSGLPV